MGNSSASQDLALANELRAVLGDVRFDLLTRILYSTDASNYQIMPVGVVIPRAADEVAAVMETCGRYGVPVLARGAGSSLAGQAVGAGAADPLRRRLDRAARQPDHAGHEIDEQPAGRLVEALARVPARGTALR